MICVTTQLTETCIHFQWECSISREEQVTPESVSSEFRICHTDLIFIKGRVNEHLIIVPLGTLSMTTSFILQTSQTQIKNKIVSPASLTSVYPGLHVGLSSNTAVNNSLRDHLV